MTTPDALRAITSVINAGADEWQAVSQGLLEHAVLDLGVAAPDRDE